MTEFTFTDWIYGSVIAVVMVASGWQFINAAAVVAGL